MSHRATPRFWQAYHILPKAIRNRADQAFALLQSDANHPSLHLKKVGDLWSERISRNHRALAIEDGDGLVWIWIGDHAEYERLIWR